MRKKTESLTFPADPLAAMRELQELNPPSPTQPLAGIGADGAEQEGPTGPIPVYRPGQTGSGSPPREQSTPAEASNPLQEAILHMLAQPYAQSPPRGPFTVTSVKMHSELWERLGLVSTLTGRPKQELVAEALREYLEKVRLAYLPHEKTGV